MSLFRYVLILLAGLMMAACATPPRPNPVIAYGPPGDPANPPQGSFQPNAYLQICPGMRVSNQPLSDGDGWIYAFHPVVWAGEVVIAAAPVNDACLSSGFGPRNGRPHKGIDLVSRPAGTVYSAAPGVVREARVSSSFGNTVLIEHGKGIFTRYAHLEFIDPYVVSGLEIGFGQPLGRMGTTGRSSGIHLHYEVLVRQAQGAPLVAINPLTLPPYIPPPPQPLPPIDDPTITYEDGIRVPVDPGTPVG